MTYKEAIAMVEEKLQCWRKIHSLSFTTFDKVVSPSRELYIFEVNRPDGGWASDGLLSITFWDEEGPDVSTKGRAMKLEEFLKIRLALLQKKPPYSN